VITLGAWLTALGIGAILGSVVTQILTTLVRGAEREYELAHEGYERLLHLTRNITEANVQEKGKAGVEELNAEIDRAWLYASDEVVKVAYKITDRARPGALVDPTLDQRLMGELVTTMRRDLWSRRALWKKFRFRRKTALGSDDYRFLGPGPRVRK